MPTHDQTEVLYALNDVIRAVASEHRLDIGDDAALDDAAHAAYAALTEHETAITTIGIWDDDPAAPIEDWRYEIANNDTRLGYHAWRVKHLTNDFDDVDAPATATDREVN